MHLKSQTIFMFAIVINSNNSHQKKMATPGCHFFSKGRIETSQAGIIKQYLYFQWICFSQGSVPILQMQVVHAAHYCVYRMIQRTARDQEIILAFSKNHSSMLRSSSLVHAC